MYFDEIYVQNYINICKNKIVSQKLFVILHKKSETGTIKNLSPHYSRPLSRGSKRAKKHSSTRQLKVYISRLAKHHVFTEWPLPLSC